MVALILEKCLAYLLLIMDVTRLLKLGVMRGVPVSLEVLRIPGGARVYRCRLTCGSMRVYLLFVQHLHFLCLVLIVALRGRVLGAHSVLVVPCLLI